MCPLLAHWVRYKMVAILQTTFANAFSWMKTWSLYLRVKLTLLQHCSDNGLAPTKWQAIIRTNDDLVYWRIYASPGLNELLCPSTVDFDSVHFTHWGLNKMADIWQTTIENFVVWFKCHLHLSLSFQLTIIQQRSWLWLAAYFDMLHAANIHLLGTHTKTLWRFT